MADEVLLELERAVVGEDDGAAALVRGRQDAAADAESRRHGGGRIGQRATLGEQPRSRHVGGEVGVAEGEPDRLAVAGEHGVRTVGVGRHAPAALRVDEPAERVEQRVDVRADVEAVQIEVIGDIRDDRELDARVEHGEPVGQLGAAGSAGKQRDLHAAAAMRRRPVLRPRAPA